MTKQLIIPLKEAHLPRQVRPVDQLHELQTQRVHAAVQRSLQHVGANTGDAPKEEKNFHCNRFFPERNPNTKKTNLLKLNKNENFSLKGIQMNRVQLGESIQRANQRSRSSLRKVG